MANLEQYLSKNAKTIQKIQTYRGTTTTTKSTPSASTKSTGILSQLGDTLKNVWEAATTPTSGQFIWQSASEAKNVYSKLADPATHAAEQARIDKLQADAKAQAEKIYLDEYKKQMEWASKNLGIVGQAVVRAGHQFITGLSGIEPPDISTGNKIADVISSIIGQGAGFITGAALLGGGNIAAAAGAKAAGVLGLDATKALAGKIVQAAIKEGVQGTMLAGIHSVINADTPKEAMQRAKDYGLMGLIGGGGGKLLGETGSALLKSIKKDPEAWKAFTVKQTKAAEKVKLKAPVEKTAAPAAEKAVTTEAARATKPQLKMPERRLATDLTPTAAELERAGIKPTEKLKTPAKTEANKEALNELQAVLQGGKPSAKFESLMNEIVSKPETYPETIVKAAQVALEKQGKAPKLEVPKAKAAKAPAEAPAREKFNEKTLAKLDDLKEKYTADKKAIEQSKLTDAEKKAKLKDLEDKYKADRNEIIYGKKEGVGEDVQKKLDKLKSEYDTRKANIKKSGLNSQDKGIQLKQAGMKYNAEKKAIMKEAATGEKMKAPEVKKITPEVKEKVAVKPTTKAAPKKMSAAEKVAKRMEIQMQEKIVKDPKSTKAQVEAAQMKIDELRAQIEAGEELFPYDPQKIEDMLKHPDKYSKEEIVTQINKVRKHVNSPEKATKTALEYSKKYLKEFQDQGYKEAKISEYKLKTPAEQAKIKEEKAAKAAEQTRLKAEREARKPTGIYKGKPATEITKADIPKEEWRRFRNKYASEEENVRLFKTNIVADKISKMDVDQARVEADSYLKSIGSEAKIADDMNSKEIGNLVAREGIKDANKKMVEKLVTDNPELIQRGKKPENWSLVTVNKHGANYYAPNDYIASQLKPLVDDGWMDIAIDKSTKMGKAWRILQVTKEMRLSGDFFLETRAVMQYLANNKMNPAGMFSRAAKLDSPEFMERELIAIKDGLTTPKVSHVAGAEERVAQQLLPPGKAGKAAGIVAKGAKKVLELEEKRMDWGYNRLQRKFKVEDYWSKRDAWKGAHPGYTEAELREAGQKIASEINAVYKGLNYKVIGYSQTSRDWMRLAMLAPDYTMSKIELIREAIHKNPAAITHILTTLIGSYAVMTQGLNVMLTGHSTFSNEAGHKLDVQVRPGLYFKTLPDWAYDIEKAVEQPVTELVGKAGFWAQPFYTAYALRKGSWDGMLELLKSPIPAPLTDIVDPKLNVLEKVLVGLGILQKQGSQKKSSTSKSSSKKGTSLADYKK
jgi:hypothetical protein